MMMLVSTALLSLAASSSADTQPEAVFLQWNFLTPEDWARINPTARDSQCESRHKITCKDAWDQQRMPRTQGTQKSILEKLKKWKDFLALDCPLS